MSRLTIKDNDNCYILPEFEREYTEDVDFYPALDKLGQHEDIEDRLGIELLTLFKALNNGIYWTAILNNFHSEIRFSENVRTNGHWIDAYDKKDKRWTNHITIADYGKTWALTKEELE